MSPLLPATGFGRLRIEALVRIRCPLPVEVHFPMRPFTLQQRFRALRPVSAAMSLFPAYIFKVIPLSSPNPFGTVLPPLPGLFLPCRARS